ncbi:MAG: hypothetical protein IJK06_01380 [Clostridia bacterium]|jgi:hypothetical protein|nr:hypothetical protein [Clostridia bacterium]
MLYLDIAVIVGELAGLVLASFENGWGQFVFYTQNSNYFLLAATLAHLYFLLKKQPVPKTVNRLKYIATCTTTVTLVVAVAVLLPMYKRPYITFLNGANLFQHTLCPILGVAALPLMDPVEKRDSILALIPTGLYALVMVPLNYFRVFDGPYPFLRVHNQSWYMSVLWLLAIFLVAFGIAVILRKVCSKVKAGH